MDLVEEKTHHKIKNQSKYKTKIRFLKKICVFIFIMAIVVYSVWQNNSFQRKFLYPYPYKNEVSFYAQRYEVDESLVAGVILTESKFKPEAISHRGAIGLMQIMPETGQWIAQQIEDDTFSVKKLTDAQFNIKYGTWYLSSLKEEFQGNEVLSLAAYNAGRGNVYEWMAEYNWNDDFSDYTKIPFPETREYVKRVLDNQKKYKELYK